MTFFLFPDAPPTPHPPPIAQWGAADAEIKVPSDENTELRHSPFKVWSRSVWSRSGVAMHATLTARDSFLLISTLPVPSPAFLSKPLPIFVSCVGPYNQIDHPVGCRFLC